jgi:hypothetical protein
MISHPSRKNKDAARVGHTGFVVRKANAGPSTSLRSAQDDRVVENYANLEK